MNIPSFATAKREVVETFSRVMEENLSLISAGVAFYIFLSIFPALAVLISIYGIVFDPEGVKQQVMVIEKLLPEDVMDILLTRLQDVASSARSSLTAGIILGILISLWSANRAMKATASALNVAYDQKEERGIIKINLVTLGLTLISIIAFIVAISAIVAVPLVSNFLLSYTLAEVFTAVSSWLLFIVALNILFLILYRFAPSWHHYHWKQLLPGSVTASLLFILASLAFSLYVSNFGSYDKQYGTLATVVITMLWLYIGSFIFLLGAEINSQRLQKKGLRGRSKNGKIFQQTN